jgi:hypothetical protein
MNDGMLQGRPRYNQSSPWQMEYSRAFIPGDSYNKPTHNRKVFRRAHLGTRDKYYAQESYSLRP